MANFKTYLNEFILSLKTEQKEHDIQSDSYTNHSILIHKFESLKNKLDTQKFKILYGVLQKKKIPRLNIGRYKNPNFNSNQLEAINGCRRQRMALIWSPPGTGKTETIAQVISNSVNKGKTVLFLSLSDKTVDEEVLKVCEAVKNPKFYASGKIIRFGDFQDELVKKKYPMVVPSQYFIWKHKIIAEQTQEFDTKINTLQEKLNKIINIVNDLNKLKQENKNLRCYRDELKKTKKDEEYIEIKKNAIRRQESDIENLVKRIKRALKNLKVSKRNTSKLKIKYEKKIGELTVKRDHLINKRNQKENEYLHGAQICLTTITKTFSDNTFPVKPYDVLIIDEANLVCMPYIFWTLTLCKDSVVFVGDFMQSPPVCLSQEADAQKWLTKNIFSFLDLDTLAKIKHSPIAFPLVFPPGPDFIADGK